MRILDGRLRYSATDLANFLACRHLTRLDLAAERGLVERPHVADLGAEALARRGEQHEAHVLDEFRARGWQIKDISEPRHDFAARTVATEEALRDGVDVIYQGTLLQDDRLGLPDFLIRADLLDGPVGYEVVDAKLARSAKARALLQATYYSRLLGETLGLEAERMHLALGNRELATFRVRNFAAYERQMDAMFQVFVARPPTFPPTDTYPEPVEHCAICRWRAACFDRRRSDDDLSLIAGMTLRQRTELKAAGVTTRRGFAALSEPPRLPRVGRASLTKAHSQARLQVEGEDRGEWLWELVDPERTEEGLLMPDRGLLALPEPAEGDLFFDIEGARYFSEDGREFGLQYLFGIVDTAALDRRRRPRYHRFWAFDRAGERKAFEDGMDFFAEHLSQHPGAHVYHYNHYEPTALDHLAELHVTREDVLRRLMGRFATREAELDGLLRRRVFVDLYRVVRQGIRASVENYSIKRLEPFYGFVRDVDLALVNERALTFEMALDEGEATIDTQGQEIIQGYNEDDCRSTLALRNWLEDRREDLASELGHELLRPPLGALEEIRMDPQVQQLRRALQEGLPEAEEERTPEQHARALVADLLEFHRREDKPKWWRYFHLKALADEELLEETDAVAGLVFEEAGDLVRKSRLYWYRFPPQEHSFKDGDPAEDPRSGTLWTIYEIDDATGSLAILRGLSRFDAPHPRSLIEPRPQFPKPNHAASLRDLARRVLEAGDQEWPRSAAFDLLLRRRPNAESAEGSMRRPGEDGLAAGRRLAVGLQRSCLPVQGPPGTGKTYTGAWQVLDLVTSGKRVGVTGTSHAVICNLLDAIAEEARDGRVAVRIGQKPGPDERWVNRAALESNLLFKGNEHLRDALQSGDVDVVGGTTWVWADPVLERALDVLLVDEAGQMSLADVLASSRAAGSVILLGDPMQLAQPSQGAHPPGADVSALGHILGEEATISEQHGLFIERTRRMHPDIRQFTSAVFYDDRLLGLDGLERQAVLGDGRLSGSGIRIVDVEHEGNANSSPEEAAAVAEAIQQVLEQQWRDKDGRRHQIGTGDVLVVTPFNAQVREIEEALEKIDLTTVRVGTVDKFQGRQAPVVLYSMASSSAEEAPRGMEFLYNLNRLNVATSRAQCLVILVASPDLVRVFCKTPRQMQLVNALCRLRDFALA